MRIIRLPVILICLLSSLSLLLVASPVQAGTGVGIIPNNIAVNDILLPGGHYELPSLQVFNTGDEASSYEVVFTRLEDAVETGIAESFLTFSPREFNLEPGAGQIIDLSLNIPIRAESGDYLVCLEAHPVNEVEGVGVNVATATKISFTVKPATTIQGLINSAIGIVQRNRTVFLIIGGIIILAAALYLIRRRYKLDFHLHLSRRK